jgi:branched-chain amino acid transport system substrate-binding protein
MRGVFATVGLAGVAVGLFSAPIAVFGQPLPGVTDTEIRIGNILPYTGPAAAWGELGPVYAAFFDMINDAGGINGRQVTFISNDDGFSPPRTLEQARRLVERDDVLLIFQSLGTPTNLAIREYMHEQGVPQLFIASGSLAFDDPQNYPWAMRWNHSFESEAVAFADHILSEFSEAKIGVLYRNDDSGRRALAVLSEQMGAAFEIVAQPYNDTDPTVDAQIAVLQAEGVDVFVNLALASYATQAIRRAAELQWRPYHLIYSGSASIAEIFEPAGIENAIDIVTVRHTIDPADPAFANHPGVVEFLRFMEDYGPDGQASVLDAYAYNVATALAEVLRRCGDDLSRENVMAQAASLSQTELPMLIPGVTIDTSPSDYAPIEAFQMARFDGRSFVLFGPIIEAELD